MRSSPPPVADVRAYYARLDIQLPSWATREASVRCFANADAHERGDRDPSCSISLTSGAWCCHGCGASGGAYDAALAVGLSPRKAIDLMVDLGLTERRAPTEPRHRPRRSPAGPIARKAERRLTQPRVSDEEIAVAHRALLAHRTLVKELERRRSWSLEVVERFELGFDGRRVVIPVRDAERRLVALMRYQPPWRRSGPKLLAEPGSRRSLFPSPAALGGGDVWLVEGHPDALAAHSIGLPALAVPGVWAWEPRWATWLAGRDVVICLDADGDGRAAAQRIAGNLRPVAHSTRVIDIAPDRDDGYDLTDEILKLRALGQLPEEVIRVAATVAPTTARERRWR
jgi:hypothetical protein